MSVGFRTPGVAAASLAGSSLAELAPCASAGLGREALVRPDQGQQRLVDALEDGAQTCVCRRAANLKHEGLMPRLMAELVSNKVKRPCAGGG